MIDAEKDDCKSSKRHSYCVSGEENDQSFANNELDERWHCGSRCLALGSLYKEQSDATAYKYRGSHISDLCLIYESLEWSPPVPSVQELAIQNLDKVPLRYVRDDLDQTTPSNPSLRVPLIDMNKSVNPEFHEKVLQKLHFAVKNGEFFR
nr:hypothetical protein CFP56_41851 [Quercus suber]